MSNPSRVLVWMAVFLAGVTAICIALFQPLAHAFTANEVFNGMILGVLVVGVIIDFRQVTGLKPEVRWIEAFREGERERLLQGPPRLLGPVATMLIGHRREKLRLSALSLRSLLDGIRLRLDESRDVSHYMVGLLIFLGLLGTFWGLLQTITSISHVIAGLSAGTDGDFSAVFQQIKQELQGPLAGMGTAFSSSLFGLAGALVLGFLDLQAGHAQNRFYNDLEEWLSESAHLPSGALSAEGEQPIPAYVQALLEQTADGLDNLQRTMTRGEEDRRLTHTHLVELTEKLSTLTDQLRSEQKAILGLTKNQMELQPAIAQLSEAAAAGWGDEELRTHVRNLDVGLSRLLDETSAARSELVDALRSEIRLLTRTVAGRSEP